MYRRGSFFFESLHREAIIIISSLTLNRQGLTCGACNCDNTKSIDAHCTLLIVVGYSPITLYEFRHEICLTFRTIIKFKDFQQSLLIAQTRLLVEYSSLLDTYPHVLHFFATK